MNINSYPITRVCANLDTSVTHRGVLDMTTSNLTERKTAPFRFDNVGSFLRPSRLKEARDAFAGGTITEEELKSVEDEAIEGLIEKQKDIGLKAITDGEFRRS